MKGWRNQVSSTETSREYSLYEDIILAGMNPQGCDDEEKEEPL